MMTFATTCFQRFGPLLHALWLNVDVGFDLRQAVVYREYAFDENGTYHRWAINNSDLSTNYNQTISHGYFQAWCVIYFLPPLFPILLCIFCGLVGGYGDEGEHDAFHEGFSMAKMFLKKCKIEINTEVCSPYGSASCIGLLCYPFLFLMEYLIWCLGYNLFTPLVGLAIGFMIALTGDFDQDLEEFPFYLSLYHYHFFVALSQLILSITFLCNNYPFLLAFDTILGFPLPISLISCIFSGGSILMAFILFLKNGIYLQKLTMINNKLVYVM